MDCKAEELTEEALKWGELTESEMEKALLAKAKEKERHKRYYQANKVVIDAKQREIDKQRNRKVASHEHYLKHKAEINERNRLRYRARCEEYSKKALEHYYENREKILERRRELYRQKKEQAI